MHGWLACRLQAYRQGRYLPGYIGFTTIRLSGSSHIPSGLGLFRIWQSGSRVKEMAGPNGSWFHYMLPVPRASSAHLSHTSLCLWDVLLLPCVTWGCLVPPFSEFEAECTHMSVNYLSFNRFSHHVTRVNFPR